ncbi:MAG: replication-associated recombination protein A [Ruminococcaceae bacterium]|nr:replication-associated recombination protein A [Oscillospiraceae bacterium]
MYAPLADRIRPKNLDEVFGQEHLTGEGRPLFKIAKSGLVPNMIFYGPSGIGKTTVANIIASKAGRTLRHLNATTASVGDIKAIIDELDTFMAPEGIVLYLDEIQYFNKKQQQTLLEYIENGKITLIASTTENPYFYVYNAILSRSTVFEFMPVKKDAVKKVLQRCFKLISEEKGINIPIDEEALSYLAVSCGGDVRKAINAAELLTLTQEDGEKITLEQAKEVAQRSSMRYDRDGDVHYDILSAFQKSIRGSDENAALHYLARLIAANDLPSICRRLLVIACEDIGLAFPQAITIVKACVDSALQLGFPEARIPLAQAVLVLATAPKSNACITAIDAALADVQSGNYSDVPKHLKDAHYEGASKLDNGKGYIYPHIMPNHYVEQQYLPDDLKDKVYFEYGNSKFEQQTKQYWEKIKGKGE